MNNSNAAIPSSPPIVVCRHCDRVYRRRALPPGETARCALCGATLYRSGHLGIDRWLALTMTAAISWMIANSYPLIHISIRGHHGETTLWQSIAALAHSEAWPMALPAMLLIMVVPCLQITLLGWILVFARLGRRAPGLAPIIRMLMSLKPWNMTEVALLGLLVAGIKLSGFLQVAPGAGLWAMAGLMVLMVIITHQETCWLWDLPARRHNGSQR